MESEGANRKIFVLIPDGVGLRNFVYGNFLKQARTSGYDVVFWNATPFDISSLGYPEIKLETPAADSWNDMLKRVRKEVELNLSKQKTNDEVYDSYRFSYSYKNIKSAVRSLLIRILVRMNSSEAGLRKIRRAIVKNERKAAYYRQVFDILKQERPDFVLSSSHRISNAIAPILAATDLKIPNAAMIFSWDNLPKATLDVEAQQYFVWSDHMKSELQYYYPGIEDKRIAVTGTPQFEIHKDKSRLVSKEVFFSAHGLDSSRKYICYSGDDVTTSPNDQLYLADVVKAVRQLNAGGHNLGIVFRRCPADFSSRFDEVLNANKDLIISIDPKWKTLGKGWATVLPTIEDLDLQLNTIAHTELVINLGSSMVFDYVSFEKPCAYINYDYPIDKGIRRRWSVKKTYNFVHFRSMPSRDCVFWLNDSKSIEATIAKMLTDNRFVVSQARQWFEKINLHPQELASKRILGSIGKTISKNRHR